jgi:acetyl-CoA synthetase
MDDAARFRAARDALLAVRDDLDRARVDFAWPSLTSFNWALDHFDQLAEAYPSRDALVVVSDDGTRTSRSFAELSARSTAVASMLLTAGIGRGERVLLMLPNTVELWETMLGCMKMGAVIVPATMQLTVRDAEDRVARGGVRHVVTNAAGVEKLSAVEGFLTKITIGSSKPNEGDWLRYSELLDGAPPNVRERLVGKTPAIAPMLLYFTSGTTAKPKLVLHTHQSYPVGHLSTMYWLGLRPGDIHWNISSPGWAKHAWSNVFAPWNAGATVVAHDAHRFSAERTLQILQDERVTSLCAPPTVWRMLILEDLLAVKHSLREAAGAGEPLNPEVIAKVRTAWGITVRDGFGQTETTALVGNAPGQPVTPGSMGRPLPGYDIQLLGPDGTPAEEGEIAVRLEPRPLGVMVGYEDDSDLTEHVMRDGFYRTGDVARRDESGAITYIGRTDDVFKSSDYRISPFELESVLVEHPAVAEAAVVPSPDPLRLSVPKAFVAIAPGCAPASPDEEAALAKDILAFVKDRVPPYKRIRRLEFVVGAQSTGDVRASVTMPKTISGKIRRVELRELESQRPPNDPLRPGEYQLD